MQLKSGDLFYYNNNLSLLWCSNQGKCVEVKNELLVYIETVNSNFKYYLPRTKRFIYCTYIDSKILFNLYLI